jgi:hypothetical protein
MFRALLRFSLIAVASCVLAYVGMAVVVFFLIQFNTGSRHAPGFALVLFWLISFVALTALSSPSRRRPTGAETVAIKCSNCSQDISLDAPACPHCGFRFGA